MSRIVVLVGSVRKGGNTELLANAFADGARSKNHEVEIISVADYKVNPCIGCNSCFQREGNACFQKDDMPKVYEKLKKADILIVASPIYFYGISAQLKALIDRLHTPMRDTFPIKKLGIILVGAATVHGLFEPIVQQYQMILKFFSLEECGMVLVSGAKDKGDVASPERKALQKAYEFGTNME